MKFIDICVTIKIVYYMCLTIRESYQNLKNIKKLKAESRAYWEIFKGGDNCTKKFYKFFLSSIKS